MSRISKRSTTRERLKSQESLSSKKSSSSPCGRKPAQIDVSDISVVALASDSSRHASYRLRVTWPEVTEDIDGFPATSIDRYIVHLQHSEDGITWDSDFRRKVVEAKDWDDNVTASAVFKAVRRKRYYRVRVRAKDRKGCKSDLSDWTSAIQPGSSAIVTGVGPITKTRVGPRRIEFDWEDSTHPDFDRYKVVVLKSTTSGGTFSVVRTRYVRHSHIAVAVSDTDKTAWWKVRVRVQLTVNPDGTRDESTDDDSDADQADDITGGRFTQVFTKNGVIEAKTYAAKWVADGNYTIKRARVIVGTHDSTTHPADGTPTGGAIYVQIKKYDTTDSNPVNIFEADERLTVAAGTHRDTAWASDVAISNIAEDEILRVRVSKVAATTYMGRDMTVSVVLEPA